MRSSMPKVHAQGRRRYRCSGTCSRGGGRRRDAHRGGASGPAPRRSRPSSAKVAPAATIHDQAERLGTAHAVLAAREGDSRKAADDVLVLYGDTPLVTAETLQRMRRALAEGADVVVLGFRPRIRRATAG